MCTNAKDSKSVKLYAKSILRAKDTIDSIRCACYFRSASEMFFQIGVSVMRYNTCVFLDFSSRQQALICPSQKKTHLCQVM